jgi:hypothetical protein
MPERQRYGNKTLTAALVGILLVLSLVILEIGARLAGWETWKVADPGVRVEPGGRLFAADPELGYTHIPGQFEVTLGTGFRFGLTHAADTLRVTGPDADASPLPTPEIWLLGCSFTHGWSLNDPESYPWRLQELLPDYRIVNFGVSGYGTVQSLIQLRRALAQGERPASIVLVYAHFHDVRNTFVRKRRKQVAPWNYLGRLTHPRARFDGDGTLQIEIVPVTYEEFPLMRYSALAHAIEMTYNDFEAWQVRSRDVTLELIEMTAAEAAAVKVPFAVAGITDSRHTVEMLQLAGERGIKTVDISTDLNRDGYTNKPHDAHPSGLATRVYADRLAAYLQAEAPGPPRTAARH